MTNLEAETARKFTEVIRKAELTNSHHVKLFLTEAMEAFTLGDYQRANIFADMALNYFDIEREFQA